MNTAIQAELPPGRLARARVCRGYGWAAGFNAVLAAALRRYLESHSTVLAEKFAREDVAWGLNGHD